MIGVKTAAVLALVAAFVVCVDAQPPTGHEHHTPPVTPSSTARTVLAAPRLDGVTLVDAAGKSVSLADAVTADTPVLLNFIFTTCTTICPVMTAGFSALERRLDAEHKPVRLVSISIDPEMDTPAALRKYASDHGAGADWWFLTGTRTASEAAQRAFNAFRGSKESHVPVTFVKRSRAAAWEQIDGLASGETLYRAYAGGDQSASLVETGERFYRRGVGAAGASVRARVQGDLEVTSTTMRCVNCHRRSGWGTVEGSVATPPIAGPWLFNPATLGASQMTIRTTGPGTRPAYDEASLARVLRDGIDPTGRPLLPTMPRYAVDGADVSALAAYLKTLGASLAPGVTPTTLHLATIVSADADPGRRDSVLNVLRAFVAAKDAGTRNEARRRDRGGFDMKDSQGVYRTWALHEWHVSGPPSTWQSQLEAEYAKQPVFAVVSGAIGGDSMPMHRFCESRGIPCLFPDAALPADTSIDEGFYSLYLSRGLPVEAAAIAQYLSTLPAKGRIVQLYRCGSVAERVAREIERTALASASCVPSTEPITTARWQSLTAGASTIVAWVGVDDLSDVAGDPRQRLVVSATLAGDRAPELATRWPSSLLATAFVSPDQFDRHAARGLIWLKSRGVTMPERESGVNALFAVSLAAETLTLPRALNSREYFIEQIEHMVGRSPLATAFPLVALGPERRFASLGSAVLKMPSAPGAAYEPVVPWFVPERSLDPKEIR